MASTIKVNNIQNQCGANIANKCGSTVTLGASGDTITLACGASQTGFGRTGTVDWNTTAITADPANAVSGTGYFANTTSAAFTITLPTSPSAGDIVAVRDYAQTFATNNLTIGRNGQPIDGLTLDLILNTNGQAITLVYVDGTQGWKSVNSNETINAIRYVAATGGTETTCGDYKIHTFTGPGTFTVTCGGSEGGSNTVDYLVVAGGGGGGSVTTNAYYGSGGGGAGGFRLSNATCMPAPQTSPLANPTGITVTATAFPITVGGGGAGGAVSPTGPDNAGNPGTSGNNSIFSTITSTGGGYGGALHPTRSGDPGGSGGGSRSGGGGSGGTGNTPPVSPPQGNNGGTPSPNSGGEAGAGGGGAGAAGTGGVAPGPAGSAGNGGAGSYVLGTGFAGSNGTPGPVCGAKYFAGGGGGGGYGPSYGGGNGGVGGGANSPPTSAPTCGQAGTTNTGGGGSGVLWNGSDSFGGSGGSGIVIIRYKYQ